MPKQKRPFVVEIEAKLTVHAFDEESARKKVEKAFASGRALGVDVDAAPESGPTSSYRIRTRREPERRHGPVFPPRRARPCRRRSQLSPSPSGRQRRNADVRPAAGVEGCAVHAELVDYWDAADALSAGDR